MTVIPKRAVSKSQALADQIRMQIEQGILASGDRLPSYSEMRAQFGATPTTVERIYSLLEHDNLIVREQGRGTFVASKKPAATGIIGLMGPPLAPNPHPYSERLMSGLREEASASGYELLLLNEESKISRNKVDGVIIYDDRVEDMEKLVRRLPEGMPCISATGITTLIPSFVPDDYSGTYRLTKHLIALGHRKIAFLFDKNSPQRAAGYYMALSDAGIVFDPRWGRPIPYLPSSYYAGGAQLAVQQWLDSDWDELGCTALLTQNDDAACGAITALREAGRSVPGEVSVTGFDNSTVYHHFTPSITTIEIPLREIGVLAVKTLIKQIKGEEVVLAATVMPVLLHERDSTAPVRDRAG
jgi:DNA-binding LacI/PurR family transcriptional regulator